MRTEVTCPPVVEELLLTTNTSLFGEASSKYLCIIFWHEYTEATNIIRMLSVMAL
ncbi:hypothetical protein [Fulvivirga sediminis]|uniref:Uncharacterized protein n=1 Tax=Fulvivirga sediminis TaxID=2803949 RepID=A0A937F649_9BACT|nr:hypothetical protein [Fulvivirga sediminis]MBL3654949.1 hypothetical protein [Fulvivirga sediminis]